MNSYIYIVSNSDFSEKNKYKIGKHTGSETKLISGYKTSLIDPKIYLFIQCKNNEQAEQAKVEIKMILKDKFIRNDNGRLSEWVILELQQLIDIVNKIMLK